MGRRKQANPTRLAEENEVHEASTSIQRENTLDADKKSTLSFSISSHLESDKIQTKNGKSGSGDVSSSANTSYSAALKSYQTLMNNLKQQEAMMKSMGFANNLNAFLMNPFFGTGMSPFDFFTNAMQMQATPKKRQKLDNSTAAVDLSTKKKRTSNDQKATDSENASNSALDKLSSLISTVGNDTSQISSIMRTRDFNGLDESSDATQVFTCLQCLDRFKSMQELVDHMEKTLHFNQLKAFANQSSSNKHKSMTCSPAKSPSPNNNEKVRANSRGGTFAFECLLCGHSSSGSIDEHMTTIHSFKSPNEWITAIKLKPV